MGPTGMPPLTYTPLAARCQGLAPTTATGVATTLAVGGAAAGVLVPSVAGCCGCFAGQEGSRGTKFTLIGPARPLKTTEPSGPFFTSQYLWCGRALPESFAARPTGATRRPPGASCCTRPCGTSAAWQATAMASKGSPWGSRYSRPLATAKLTWFWSSGQQAAMVRCACSTCRAKRSMATTVPPRGATRRASTAVRKPVPQPTSSTRGGRPARPARAGCRSCTRTM
mmetsp:Transcript_113182/g.365693  ORF Transcript_113182/g.365693 Transcript_113182/m.365693 type:complete len:226 (-) Transcript_113182:396-1073(-)